MRPLKSLLICPTEPRPDGAGIQRRAWSHLEALSDAGEVDVVLALLADQIARLGNLDALIARCRSLTIVRIAEKSRRRKFRLMALTAMLRLVTIGRPRYGIEATILQQKDTLANAVVHDLTFCFRLRAFNLLPDIRHHLEISATKLVVDFDDIESVALERELAATSVNLGMEQRVLLQIERLEADADERRARRSADGIIVCSDADRQHLIRRETTATVIVVPNSYPKVERLPPSPTGPTRTMLFLGTMTYKPNEDAALYFCETIFPLIRAKTSTPVTVEIVGRGPSKLVRALRRIPGVVVMGGVDHVEPHYARAQVVVAPIRFGGGTRIKIIEALAFGRPVVATSAGAEGLELAPSKEILIADEAHAFASACLELLNDADLQVTIADAGRAAYLRLYEAQQVQRLMMECIRRLFNRSAMEDGEPSREPDDQIT